MTSANKDTDAANKGAFETLKAASPFLVDICPAGQVIGRVGALDFLHAGPPLDGWSEAGWLNPSQPSIQPAKPPAFCQIAAAAPRKWTGQVVSPGVSHHVRGYP